MVSVLGLAAVAAFTVFLQITDCLRNVFCSDKSVTLSAPGTSAAVATDDRVSRATTHHVIELLIVADYSSFRKWYANTSTHDSQSQRTSDAIRNIKEYAAALIHSSNKVYESLEPHNIFIKVKLVDVLVMTSASESTWTEQTKRQYSPKPYVDPTVVLPLFQPKSVSLQSTVPHDHAMILTMYSLWHGGGGTFSGYAYTDAECKQKSISIVEDNEDFYTAQLIAHEIGHSLGCQHDGTGNSCPTGQGYAMEASFILANKKKWTFSSCSVNYIRNYLSDLNQHQNNCLKTTQNHHPSSEVAGFFTKWYGQVYDADQQCQMKYGTTSYLCRDRYYDDYSAICLKLKCYIADRDTCWYIDGGDGTPCGNRKWCMSDECVSDSNAPDVPDDCPVGDQPGIVKNGRTCAQLISSTPSECSDSEIKYKCCKTCGSGSTVHSQVSTHPPAATHPPAVTHQSSQNHHEYIDHQCARKHGRGSIFCRGAVAYDGHLYSDLVCSNLQCSDPSRDDWCLSGPADDYTICGNKKWCINQQCVYDSGAVALSDTCPYGDQPGYVVGSLTCNDLRDPRYHWRCYHEYTNRRCCSTCITIRRNVKNCQYGDKSDWCQTNIASQRDKSTCYYGNNEDLCCESCSKYKNTAHVGCEYGDKWTTCSSRSCSTYSSHSLSNCCETCSGPAIIG